MNDIIPLSFFQKINLWFIGSVKIGTVQREGWTDPVNLYAFKCRDHGLVASNVSGYNRVLKCPHCWEFVNKMTEITKNEKVDTRSFTFWFYLFAALTVALVMFNQGISVESAHSLVLMLLVRQIGLTWKGEQEVIARGAEDQRLFELIVDLGERVDKIDPYSEDIEE